ncbi:MAG: hypothetical protein GC162_20025 [Planctomycetes bacterium]|nr:hypothetical protein [Planctomycetota bacterium]
MKPIIRAAVVIAQLASLASAMFAPPTDAPVDRIVKNATAYVTEHPDDASGYYVLGRTHYLAWTTKSGAVPIYRGADKSGKPAVVGDFGLSMYQGMALSKEAQKRAMKEFGLAEGNNIPADQRQKFYQRMQAIQQELEKSNWTPDPLPVEQLDVHAEAAVKNFRIAIEKDPDNGLYHLGLASICEQYAPRAGERKLGFTADAPMVDAEQAIAQWRDAAMTGYRKAFDLTKDKDAALKNRPIDGINWLVSFEAAEGYKRVSEAAGKTDRAVALVMDQHMAKLAALPFGAITPMVFSFEPQVGLGDLIDDQRAVMFDLDGMGPRKWTWIKPGTALLVWDPDHTGRITSGRQLFGSVTWWLLPGDGYRAMDLLDDNRDGKLSGEELRGLAAWFDANADGISDAGEVVPLDQLPIKSLSTHAMSVEPRGLSNANGMQLDNGATLPTYDWFALPGK